MSRNILFCIPYAGGSARSLANVTYRLGNNIQVKGLELPGRGNRFLEPLSTDLETILDELFESVCESIEDAKQQVFIWGHSMGAILALMLAVRMKENGYNNVCGLIVSAMTGPDEINKANSKLHLLPHNEFLEYFAKLTPPGKGIVDKQRNGKLLERMSLILRSDIEALEKFTINDIDSIVIDAPIHVLIGKNDEIMPNHYDYNSWQFHTLDEVKNYLINGGHFFVLEQSDQTASIIQEIINSHQCTLKN